MEYELFYLVGATREGELEKIKKSAEETVTHFGGVFREKETTEKRRLSYIVKHETHGIYIARRFDLEKPENIREITAKLNLNADILRFIISRAEELPALKSKEERISDAQKAELSARYQKETKPEIKETKKEEKKEPSTPETSPEEKKNKEEDIDKKLEEILNI